MRELNFRSIPSNRASVSITTSLYDRRALDCTADKPLINSLNHLTYLASSSARVRDTLCVDGGLERLVSILKQCQESTHCHRGECCPQQVAPMEQNLDSKSHDNVQLSAQQNLCDKNNTNNNINNNLYFNDDKELDEDEEKLDDSIVDMDLSCDDDLFRGGEQVVQQVVQQTPQLQQQVPSPCEMHDHQNRCAMRNLYTAWKWTLSFQCLVFIGTRGTEAIRRRVVEAGLIPVVATVLDNFLQAVERMKEQRIQAQHEIQKRISSSVTSVAAPQQDFSNHQRQSTRQINPFPSHGGRPLVSSLGHQPAAAGTRIILNGSLITTFPSLLNPSNAFQLSNINNITSDTNTSASTGSMDNHHGLQLRPVQSNTSSVASTFSHSTASSVETDSITVSTSPSSSLIIDSSELSSASSSISSLRPSVIPRGGHFHSQASNAVFRANVHASREPSILDSTASSTGNNDNRRDIEMRSISPESQETPATVDPQQLHHISHQHHHNHHNHHHQHHHHHNHLGSVQELDREPEQDTEQSVTVAPTIGDTVVGTVTTEFNNVDINNNTGEADWAQRDAMRQPRLLRPSDITGGAQQNQAQRLGAMNPNAPLHVSGSVSPRYFHHGVIVPREEDVIWALEILAFVSKYAYLKEYLQCSHLIPAMSVRDRTKPPLVREGQGHNACGQHDCSMFDLSSKSKKSVRSRVYDDYDFENEDDIDDEYLADNINVFPLVENFTQKHFPNEVQYWAGVTMRNSCRKDESRGGIRQCANFDCGKWEEFPRQFAKCRRCKRTKYCSKDCQLESWRFHRHWCVASGPASSSSRTSATSSTISQQPLSTAAPTNNQQNDSMTLSA